jgi:exopolysaccharide biosynthesis polyprenyl glycosylphosphotransferase
MIRRHAYLFRLALMAADAALALAVVGIAAMLRFGGAEDWQTALDSSLPDPQLAVAAFVLVWIDLLWYHGLYRSRARWNIQSDVSEILKATVALAAIALSALFLFKLPDVSRLFLLFVFPMLALAALSVRILMRLFLIYLREHGRNTRYMLILGANRKAKVFADLVESHAELGLLVVGHLQAGEADNGVRLRRRVIGTIDDLEAVLHSRIIDEVAICLPFSMEDLVEQAARLCQQEGKVVRIPVAPVERALSLGRFETIDGTGVYSLADGPDRTLGLIAKRVIDLVGAATLLFLLSPALLAVALAIKLDSRGPVFFRQERLGLQGRAFQVIKFRTMCVDAERQLEDLRKLNEINGHAFKIHNDPRITRVGRFLRRTSLDELPQLWNVLLGQMSLVGPRPPLPSEVAKYDFWHRRRLSMKPGMTGLWQVTRRRSPEFDEWVEQDLRYIDSWSLWLDFKIIARTVPVMLSGQGR